MVKVKTLDDLKKLKQELQGQVNLREKAVNAEGHVQIKVAMATCGIASGAKNVMDYLIDEMDKRSVEAVVTQTGCMGYCYAEPTVEVKLPGQEPVVFGYVDLKKADDIIEKYIKNGELLDGILPVNYETV